MQFCKVCGAEGKSMICGTCSELINNLFNIKHALFMNPKEAHKPFASIYSHLSKRGTEISHFEEKDCLRSFKFAPGKNLEYTVTSGTAISRHEDFGEYLGFKIAADRQKTQLKLYIAKEKEVIEQCGELGEMIHRLHSDYKKIPEITNRIIDEIDQMGRIMFSQYAAGK